LRNVLRNPEDLPVVLADQRIVGRDIAAAHPFNQGYVGMRFEFSCNRLDGRHGGWLREWDTLDGRSSPIRAHLALTALVRADRSSPKAA
jgi:hypothetical protein